MLSRLSKKQCCAIVCGVLLLIPLLVIIISLALSALTTVNSIGPRVSPTLQFVMVVSRHGNRRTIFDFPKDPYPQNHWPYGLGELTVYGRVQMFNLGVKVRSLYDGFLNTSYCSKNFQATSTPTAETLMSAEAFLTGLYPPKGFQLWNKKIPWQPIPVFTDPTDNSHRLHGSCPKYEMEEQISKEEFDEQNAELISAVQDYLGKYTGMNMTQDDILYKVWDTLVAEDVEGFVLPDWTDKVYPEPLNNLIGKFYVAVAAGTDTIIRLVIGQFYDYINQLMESKMNNSSDSNRQLYFYSGHDFTLTALQGVLGIPKSSIIGLVKPGSALILELHKDTAASEYTVQVLYIDGHSVDLEPVPLKVPACNYSCSYNNLLNITKQFRNVSSFEEECKLNSSTISQYNK